MQYLLAAIALSLVALLLNLPTTAAKHAQCYWKGPGTGTPEKQGFSLFGTGRQRQQTFNDKPTIVQFYCEDYDDKPVVADWNNLNKDTLEIATPCGSSGFSGDCGWGLWAFRLDGYYDHNTNESSPVRYLRKTDDCEWIGTMRYDQLPQTITVYHR